MRRHRNFGLNTFYSTHCKQKTTKMSLKNIHKYGRCTTKPKKGELFYFTVHIVSINLSTGYKQCLMCGLLCKHSFFVVSRLFVCGGFVVFFLLLAFFFVYFLLCFWFSNASFWNIIYFMHR